MPTVSVVVPTYNASAFIRRTLASVFAQSALPGEVIVADDCSGDDTVAIVEEIAKAAPIGVRVIRLPMNSGGPARPLNVGIEAATGELIATLDHDDTMSTNRLSDQLSAFALCPDAGLILGRLAGGESSSARDSLTAKGWAVLRSLRARKMDAGVFRIAAADAYLAVLEHGCYALTCSSMLFPKRVWNEVGRFDERIRTSCDLDFLQAVSGRCDIAYTTALVGEWSAPEHTLYSTSGLRRKFRDHWIILDRFAARVPSREMKRVWPGIVRETLHEYGYAFRKCGDLRMAALCQFLTWRSCGISVRPFGEFIKIAASAVLPRPKVAAL